MAEHPTHQDWGLLLNRIVVLDADDADAVAWLEGLAEDGTAPPLKRCPAPETSKGRHYFMLRSAEADKEGFYDGARQVKGGKSIDLKTLCSTGTRGIAVVSPTPGKSWLPGRAPWDSGVELQEAPTHLLRLVATPKKGRGTSVPKATRGTKAEKGSESSSRGHGQEEGSSLPPHPIVTLPSVAQSDPIVRLLHLLGKWRWDDRATWRDTATALKNEHGNRYLDTWLTLSKISTKFDEREARELWASVARAGYTGAKLTLRTVHRWAQQDDPLGYQALRSDMELPFNLAKFRQEERGLAEMAFRALSGVVKEVGKDSKRDIYWFDEDKCRWFKGTEASILIMTSHAVEVALLDLRVHLAKQAATVPLSEDRAGELKSLEEDKKTLDRMIKLNRTKRGMANVVSLMAPMCHDDEFELLLDSKRNLLGVKNGVIELQTGKLRPRRPEDMIYTVLDVDYDPEADTTLMAATVLAIMAGDPEMVAYLQKLLGYAITGEVCEEIFVVFTAKGRNGKGLLMQCLQKVLGVFYQEMNKAIIVANARAANLDAEFGKLLGVRLAVFNELESDDRLKTSAVQMLSGGDGVPATPKYRNPMTIMPRHLCILTTNHEPPLEPPVLVATVERFQMVPFPVTFADLAPGEQETPTRRQRDNDLKDRLMGDKAMLLRWLVQGAVAWYASKDLKRNAPAKVKEFSRKFFEQQDNLAEFLTQQCKVTDGSQHTLSADFLREYNSFLADGELPTVNKFSLAKLMRHKGFEPETQRVSLANDDESSHTRRVYKGIVLLPKVSKAVARNGGSEAVADEAIQF